MKSNPKTKDGSGLLTETVTLAFDVKLQYQTTAGRDYLLASLKRDARVDMCGAGADLGAYAIKSVEGTERVWPANEIRTQPDGQ